MNIFGDLVILPCHRCLIFLCCSGNIQFYHYLILEKLLIAPFKLSGTNWLYKTVVKKIPKNSESLKYSDFFSPKYLFLSQHGRIYWSCSLCSPEFVDLFREKAGRNPRRGNSTCNSYVQNRLVVEQRWCWNLTWETNSQMHWLYKEQTGVQSTLKLTLDTLY